MTIFNKIINKEIKSNILYEDEDIMVILDAFPLTKGHSLVLPKQQSKNFLEMEDSDISIIFPKIKKIAKILCEKLNADGCNIITNINEAADQSVFYTHFHILPRYKDGYKLFNARQELQLDLVQLCNELKFNL